LKTSVLILAGENSGEQYGADLVSQFRKIHPHVEFFGIGGNQMEKEGVQLLHSVRELAVVGLVETFYYLPRILKIFKSIQKEVKARKPAAAVLIDSPDFNLRLAKKLKKLSVPVLYYLSPTVWAWRKGRLKTIKKNVRKMMLIFPFEQDIYRAKNIPALYAGHPLLSKVHVSLSRDEFCRKHGIQHEKKIIAVLPGSRRSEIKRHLPVINKTMEKIHSEYPVQFILVLAENMDKNIVIQGRSDKTQDIISLKEDRYEAMAYADLALSSCGTANLELALLETPFLAFYRLSSITYNLGIHLIKIRAYSIVNILAGAPIIPELIQRHFTSEKVFRAAKEILDSEERQKNMIDEFRRIKSLLGDRNAPRTVALELSKLIGE
jgi:lipid-A-disaccharide synthase